MMMLRRKFLQLFGLAPLAAVPAATALDTPAQVTTKVTALWDEADKVLRVFVDGKHVRDLTLQEIVLDWAPPVPQETRPEKPVPPHWTATTTTVPAPTHYHVYVWNISTNSWEFSPERTW